MRNIDNILKDGLCAKRCNAICTVRSCDERVWDSIINGQLSGFGDKEYAIIKLRPSIHDIAYEDLAADSTNEPTTPLHTYICKSCIRINKDDIACPNYKASTKYRAIPENIIEELTDYARQPIPDVSILNYFI